MSEARKLICTGAGDFPTYSTSAVGGYKVRPDMASGSSISFDNADKIGELLFRVLTLRAKINLITMDVKKDKWNTEWKKWSGDDQGPKITEEDREFMAIRLKNELGMALSGLTRVNVTGIYIGLEAIDVQEYKHSLATPYPPAD